MEQGTESEEDMMSKFKKGDEVIVVRNHRNVSYSDYVGRSFIIDEISKGNKAAYPVMVNGAYAAYLKDLEFKDVFESPLYKALS